MPVDIYAQNETQLIIARKIMLTREDASQTFTRQKTNKPDLRVIWSRSLRAKMPRKQNGALNESNGAFGKKFITRENVEKQNGA